MRHLLFVVVSVPALVLWVTACGDDKTPGPGPEPQAEVWEEAYATIFDPIPDDEGIADLWFNAPADGWACVGSWVIRYDGSEWEKFSDAAFSPDYRYLSLTSVCALNDHDIWVAGKNYTAAGPEVDLLHYDGVSWTPIDILEVEKVYDISFLAPNAGWLAADGGIYYYDGAAWAKQAGGVFRSLAMTAVDCGYASTYDDVFRWDGATWTRLYLDAGAPLKGVTFADAAHGWAYTADTVYSYNGSSWEALEVPNGGITAAALGTPNQGWVIADGNSWHYRGGGGFHDSGYPLNRPAATSVWITASGDAWAGTPRVIWPGQGNSYPEAYIFHAPSTAP